MFAEAATALGGRFGRRGGRQQGGEPGAELGPVRLGDAEQLADHGERQREGEARDQVDDGVAAAVQLVEQVVDDRLDAGPQRGDPRAAERGRGQPAQPGVVGRVDAEHVPGERGAGQALGDHRAVAGERGVHVLGQPRVVQRGPGLGVRTTSQARCPSGSVTSCTGPSARTCANSGNGLSRS